MSIPYKVQQAHNLLKLDMHVPTTTTKKDIQHAFRERAQIYHPDSQHPLRCPTRFRECHDARGVLLDYYYHNNGRQRRQQSSSNTYHHGAGRSDRSFYARDGFAPSSSRTRMRILTVRQNLTLRAIVMTALTVGTFYSDYSNNRTNNVDHVGIN
mmetsp:Transcript_11984/g.19874  ORF Transcript_11984/g.19874 Transcript_11984/m.19874 type:complete len:154 (+) Transcript_11984:76-537(+)